METKYVGVKSCADDPQHGTEAAPYATIQYGVDQLANLNGGLLIVQNGRYQGGIYMNTPQYSNIEIRGETQISGWGPPSAFCEARPVVDAGNQDSVFTIAKATGVKLTNLCIVNGLAPSGTAPNTQSVGGGVYAGNAQVSLNSCCFQNNTANWGGAFAFLNCHSGACFVTDCYVLNNAAKPGHGPRRGSGERRRRWLPVFLPRGIHRTL